MVKTQIDPSCNGHPFTNHHRHICKPHDGAAVGFFSCNGVYMYVQLHMNIESLKHSFPQGWCVYSGGSYV